MRRVMGLVATALGTLLIVLAVVLRFYVVGQVVKFPLDENTVTTMTASHVNYFSPSQLEEESGVSMTETTTTQGDVAAGSSALAVWNSSSYFYDDTNQQAYNSSLERLAFDRRTAQLVNCCGTNINSKKKHVSGLGYVWPFGAQKKSYEIFDTTLLQPHPVSYAGTAAVDGLGTYQYVEDVTPTRIGTETLPGSLVGMTDQQTVQLGEYYEGTTTDWVDPVTGTPVRVVSSRHLYLVDSSGTAVLNLLQATFSTTPGSVAVAVHTARSDDAKISLVSVAIPAVLALSGLIVLIIGLILARTGATYSEEDDQAMIVASRSDCGGGGQLRA
jgi:Porin PorA